MNAIIADIAPCHHAALLKMNAEFVHWLAPLDSISLIQTLTQAAYARQIGDGAGILIGFAHDIDDPDHKNLNWLRGRVDNFFYIERVIISRSAQGQGYGRRLYQDVEAFARSAGYSALACEVNTQPDNPASHGFHLKFGFAALGEQDFPNFEKSVRYYAKPL